MNQLVELTGQWAKKQLEYPPNFPYSGNHPRNYAAQVLVQSKIVRGLVVSLPLQTAKPLLNHMFDRIQSAHAQFDDMEIDQLNWSLVKDSIGELSKAFAYVGDYDRGLQTVQLFHEVSGLGVEQRIKMIGELALAAYDAGDLEDSHNLIAIAQQEASQIVIAGFQSGAYAQLVSHLSKMKNVEKAVEIALLITNQGTSARRHLHRFIHHLIETQLFDEAERVARHLTSPVEQGITLCDISSALVSIKPEYSRALIAEVEQLAISQADIKSQIRLYSVLMVAYHVIQNQEKFRQYFKLATDLASSFEERTSPSPLTDYVIALAKVGHIDDAFQFADSIVAKERGKEFVRRWIIDSLIVFLINNQRFEDAQHIIKKFVASDYDKGQKPINGSDLYHATIRLIFLAVEYTEIGQMGEAEKILDDIMAQVRQFDSENFPMFGSPVTTRLYSQYERYNEMFEILDQIGFDKFAQVMASSAKHFESIKTGLSREILDKIINIGAQKYDDYAELLRFISV